MKSKPRTKFILKTKNGKVTELTNMFPNKSGEIMSRVPMLDAVVVQFIGYEYDDDGNKYPRFATHIECKCMKNIEVLRKKAKEMLK